MRADHVIATTVARAEHAFAQVAVEDAAVHVRVVTVRDDLVRAHARQVGLQVAAHVTFEQLVVVLETNRTRDVTADKK